MDPGVHCPSWGVVIEGAGVGPADRLRRRDTCTTPGSEDFFPDCHNARVDLGAGRIVGREAELALLEPEGAGGALLLCGEPGIGKSTVWAAAVERFRGARAAVLTARPAQAETRLAFAGLTDLLGDTVNEVAAELSTPRAHALRVAMLQEDTDGPVDRLAIGLAVLDTMRLLARANGRLLVAVDDAQWLDAETEAALAFALRRLTDGSVVVLLSRRNGPDTVLEQALSRPPRRVELSGLTAGALLRIVRDQLGQSISLPAISRIHDLTGGNPFYALELARRALASGDVPVPSSLPALAEERIRSLPAMSLEALVEVAALADPVVDLVVLRALEPALATGVLELHGEHLRFTHPLLRSAVYEMATPAQRRRVHRRLAGRVTGEERARHLGLGTEGPSGKVASALELAARSVAARGGVHTAVELADLAVQRAPAADRADLVVSAAEYRLVAGDPRGARGALEAVIPQLRGDLRARGLIALAWTREDDFEAAGALCEQALESTSDDRLAADAHARRAEFALGQGRLGLALAHGAEAVRRAEAAGDTARLVHALAYTAHFQTLAGAMEPGVLERALELEEPLDRPSAYYGPRAMLGLRLMWSDRLAAARTAFEQALTQARAAGEEVARAVLLLHLADAETRSGAWGDARGHVEEAALLAEEIGLVQIRSGALWVSAMLSALAGRVEDARARARAGLEASRGAREVIFEAQNRAVLGFIELSLGNAQAAVGAMDELPALYERIGYGNPGANPFLPNLIEAEIQIGETSSAASHIDALLERAEALENPWAQAAAARCRGLLALAGERPAEAVTLLEEALVAHERSENPFERARTLLALGQAHRRQNRRRLARERLDQAHAVFTDLGAPLWADRASAERARIGGRAARGSNELTGTERRVAVLVAEGRTNREVADALVVSERTVTTHLTHIYSKLGVRSRTELVRRMAQEG